VEELKDESFALNCSLTFLVLCFQLPKSLVKDG
jgi:hypothetical protein